MARDLFARVGRSVGRSVRRLSLAASHLFLGSFGSHHDGGHIQTVPGHSGHRRSTIFPHSSRAFLVEVFHVHGSVVDCSVDVETLPSKNLTRIRLAVLYWNETFTPQPWLPQQIPSKHLEENAKQHVLGSTLRFFHADLRPAMSPVAAVIHQPASWVDDWAKKTPNDTAAQQVVTKSRPWWWSTPSATSSWSSVGIADDRKLSMSKLFERSQAFGWIPALKEIQ